MRLEDDMMRAMEKSRKEIEIKLPFDSPAEAMAGIDGMGAELVREREFEDNLLFERDREPLKPANKLLRLRREGASALLTFKSAVPGTHSHKVRNEEETAVSDPAALERIMIGLGFHPSYRYQKYRTVFDLDGLEICLDETPLGCFLELEGEPQAIDRAAAALGFSPEQYIVESYRDLHEKEAEARGVEPGDLVFEP
jgi:adenylate cyclase class 2